MKIRIFEVNIKPLADEMEKVNSKMEKFEDGFQPMKPYLIMNSKTACPVGINTQQCIKNGNDCANCWNNWLNGKDFF